MDLGYRQQVAFMGMLVGAVVGGVAAVLWLDYRGDEELDRTKAKMGYGDLARLTTATISLVRQVNQMAKLDEEE